MLKQKSLILGFVALGLLTAGSAAAQPSPAELSEQMYQANEERLSGIESLELTVEMNMGGTVMNESTTRYVKEVNNGRTMLVTEKSGDMDDSELVEGMYDGTLEELVAGAESVENDEVNGRSVYRLVIRDRELLNQMEGEAFEADEREFEIDKGTLWIDRDMLVPVRMIYEQEDGEPGISMEIQMSDFETHSGLPVARTMSFEIEGMDQMFTEEEMAEARNAMKEMREQLDQMPEAQREMIENQMSGQIEKFEQMVESGNVGSNTVKVTSVKVN